MARYLEHSEVLVIHARIIDETGGAHGIRDLNLVLSMTNRPQMEFGGKELYQGIFLKAAAYFESCALHHAFIDGNKRTAIAFAARFLHLNNYELKASNEQLEKFVLAAVIKKYSLEAIADWFKKHTKSLKRS